ncbi:LacI family DNA-binding transcriptional regulator [Lederbergia citrea]|uniref:LacI family DNA-binding transcriptional regulator n=1 Tax=Lederbergia citrea TaxID=2833581 RepID=A0A942UQ95_9BACI|nr:LacI family DNA-binding transcriptional regulator [Lederbergia citrea]MBS4224107.1 LacI family DNA-binding transcriptional regulator [Lederbergia citrea]
MKVKLEDVAKAAGVSPTTVSRVLNNRGYISDRTRAKVEEAIKELNYYPNDVARSLFKKRTNFIGLILPTVSNPFFGQLALYIENLCSTLGYKVILCNSSGQIEKEKSYSTMLIRHQVDGMIVCSYNRGIDTYMYPKLPIVAIDHYLSPTIPVVGSDNYAGGKLAIQHLIEQGCKSIIHINGPLEIETPAQLRRKAYEDLVENSVTYELPFEDEDTIVSIRKILKERPETDGIFASDDIIAAACLQVAREMNIHVPGQLKVVGYDGTETTMSLLPQLTTIKQPIEDIAKTSVLKLMDMIDNSEFSGPYETSLPVQLLINETT